MTAHDRDLKIESLDAERQALIRQRDEEVLAAGMLGDLICVGMIDQIRHEEDEPSYRLSSRAKTILSTLYARGDRFMPPSTPA